MINEVSVVIPAYNEENAITETVASLRATFSEAKISSVEIIIVDDGSTDATAAIARKEGVKVISHPHNIGYGGSLKDGISAARYDTIVISDADGTYPVDKIPELLALYEQGFDMVVGSRQGKNYKESFKKSVLRSVLKGLVEFTAGRRIPDINSGLRVFSRRTVMTYFTHLCDGFSFTTSVTLAYMLTAKFVTYTPISYHKREGNSKVRLFQDSLRTLQFIIQAIVYYNPMKIFLIVSLVALLFAFAASAIALSFCSSFAWLAASVFAGVSILVFSMGLLADLLRQLNLK